MYLSIFKEYRDMMANMSQCPPGSEDLVWYNNPDSSYSLLLCLGQY